MPSKSAILPGRGIGVREAPSKSPGVADRLVAHIGNGFDQQGCDYLANVAYGARNSLAIGLFAVIGVLLIGVIVGAMAGG